MAPARRLIMRLGLGLAATVVVTPAVAYANIDLIPEVEVLAVNFLVLLALIYPVNKLLIRPLTALLIERERRSSGAIERAAAIAAEASGLRESIAARLTAARAAAQVRRAEILGIAQERERTTLDAARRAANESVAGVRGVIAEELGTARNGLEEQARELAREAATSILGRAL